MDQKSPDAFRTISEVAEWLETPAHVLRFWESRFPQVKPVKRAGGRRYYRPADMALLGGIKKLLHDDGLTIRGVQKILRSEGVKHVAELSPSLDESDDKKPSNATQETAKTNVSAAKDSAPAQPIKEPVSTEETLPEKEAVAEEVDLKQQDLTTSDPQPEFAFTAPEPASPNPNPPQQPQKVDLSSIPDVPDDNDPRFDAEPGAFPLRNLSAARKKLQSDPAKAAALYERLVTLSGRMPEARH